MQLQLQLVYLSPHDFQFFLSVRHLPGTGAFVGDAVIASGTNMHELCTILTERLTAWESYRSKLRKTEPRECTINNVYAELPDGKLINLIEGDSFSAVGHVRLKPTESVSLSRERDESCFGMLPPNALDTIACETPKDVTSLCGSSLTVKAQYINRPIKRLVMVVDGW